MPEAARAAPVDAATLSRVRRGRLARLREQMAGHDMAAVVLVDPVNVRYATDTRNMQIFSARNPARYAFVALDGPVIVFEFAGCEHLSRGAELVDEVRVATTASYVAAATRLDEATARWADEIADLVRSHGGGSRRVGIERFSAAAAFALAARGLEVLDAQAPVERARAVKVPGEIELMRESVAAVEEAVGALREAIRPGITETALWSVLWRHVIAAGGDYVETRLLNSGPRTNPWFQECSGRVLEAGDLVALDTDVVGRHGYYADFSRTFLCGAGRPSAVQRTLYALAHEQIEHNLALIRPGATFREVSEQGWRIPGRYHARRYYLLAHGIGMTGEYPYIVDRADRDAGGYDGVIEPGMVLCVESFIGDEAGGEGVKLEQQVHVTAEGCELMSRFPLEEALLGG